MEKVKLFDNNGVKIRYVLTNNTPWFFTKDVFKSLGYENSTSLLINPEDKRIVSYAGSVKAETSEAISLHAVGSLINITACSGNSSTSKEFKDTFYNKIIPTMMGGCISDEDRAILNIIHSKNDTEKAKSISEYKTVITKPASITTKVDSNKVFTMSDVTEIFKLKKGQVSTYFQDLGLFYYGGKGNKNPIITDDGRDYLCKRDIGTSKQKLCITDNGFKLIEENISEISMSDTRIKRKEM